MRPSSEPPAPARTAAARTVRIGITGPIGCGKSTVAAWLGELGAVVVDADQVARQVTEPGTQALYDIVSTFGEDLLGDDGSLDRAALGRLVFADPASLSALEAIVHPAVRPVILEAVASAERAGAPAVAIEAIKLVEGGLADLCDEVWLVTCSAAVQLERVRRRDGKAEARIAAQGNLVERRTPRATRVLDTSGTFQDTRELVAAAYQRAVEG